MDEKIAISGSQNVTVPNQSKIVSKPTIIATDADMLTSIVLVLLHLDSLLI